MKGPFTLKWGDDEIEVEVDSVNLEYETTHDTDNWLDSNRFEYSASIEARATIEGRVTYMGITRDKCQTILPDYNKKEKDMCRDRMDCNDSCAVEEKACDNPYYGGHALVKKLNDLTLTEDDRLLLKYNVIREDGTITETGKEVLLNLLLNKHSDVILESLRQLDAEDKKKKK